MKRMNRIIALGLVIVMVILCVSACVNNHSGNVANTNEDDSITIVDMAGNSITLDEYPTSIFCQSSMFEQIVLALGAESTLRASSYSRANDARSDWFQALYPQILDVEPAGGDENGITNELLVSYELDLMFVGNQDQYNEFVAIGIPCVVLDIQSLDDLLESIEIMGRCLGGKYQEKAKNIVAYCTGLLSEVEKKSCQIPDEKKVTAYFMESRYAATEPTLYMTWGTDSFQVNCLNLAGVNSVTEGLFEGGARVEITTEQLILSNPDAIVIGGFYEQVNYEALIQDENLKILDAVKNGQIYRVPIGASEWTRIGVESVLLPLWYGTVFYPELYEDVDINAVVKNFYKNVMGIDLTEEYQTLILSGAEGPAK